MWAAADGAQTALVIGNAAYPQSLLVNPTNDAKAMHTLLDNAGFSVDLQLDASRTTMLEAIERFGKRVQSSDTKLAVFYYAGHGAQLDWRNYLLPVNAAVSSAAALKADCIELGQVLDHFVLAQRKGAEKTFVVILDACRDNPFGTAYKPQNKGLSQFDAPVGSLLAYATAPGNVAFDGTRKNGLYTENLVEELSRPGVRIEDALKRVRLNVRLASGGEQIPWESTSLESDVFIFLRAAPKLSEEEVERQVEEEVAHWNRIKTSRRAEDWIEYLRKYPNGRFSEIAQARLNALLGTQGQRQSHSAVKPKRISPGAEQADLAEGEALVPVETLAAVSHNPYSAGRFPLGRKFTVGDSYILRSSDLLTGSVKNTFQNRVTRVDEDNDRVEMNHGKLVVDLMGNAVENRDNVADVPQQLFPAELQVGKRWTSLNNVVMKIGRSAGETKRVTMDVSIQAREKIRVPAGEYNAFRIVASGWSVGDRNATKIEVKLWVVPGINVFIRRERIKQRGNRLVESDLTELVAIRQAASGLAG
ncbi:MAG: caspase family protein [Propionivibrio sp.]|nr:caspase family protein [Propionivibrio sp.]